MTRRPWAIIALLFAVSLSYIVWTQVMEKAPEKIVITGSPLMEPLVADLAHEFRKSFPTVEIEVTASDTVSALAHIMDRHALVAMVARPLKEDESELIPHKIATDGLAIITNAANPVASINFDGMSEVLRREIGNWQQLGGQDAAIQVIHKPLGYSTTEVFLRYFGLNPEEVAIDRSLVDFNDTVTAISESPEALAYVSIALLEASDRHARSINVLPLDGVSATSENVRNGSYPLIVPLNLVTVGQPEGLLKEFIRFAQSQKAQSIVRSKRFVPNGVS